MLAVRAGRSPHDLTGRHRHGHTVGSTELAVALHLQLLEVRSAACRARARTARPPGSGRRGSSRYQQASRPHEHRHVLGPRRPTEVLVHFVRAGEQRGELVRPDGRPSTTARSPTTSSTGRRPNPRTRTCCRCRCRTPLPHRRSSTPRRSASRPRRRRARQRNQLRAERAFVSVSSVVNDFDETTNKRLGRFGSRSARREIGAVDVGHEAALELGAAVRAQRVVGHRGAEVAAADADVHDRADAPARVPRPLARPHPIGERAHSVEDTVHLGDDVDTVDRQATRPVASAARRAGPVDPRRRLMWSPRNIASMRPRRSRASASAHKSPIVSAVMRCLEKSKYQPATSREKVSARRGSAANRPRCRARERRRRRVRPRAPRARATRAGRRRHARRSGIRTAGVAVRTAADRPRGSTP